MDNSIKKNKRELLLIILLVFFIGLLIFIVMYVLMNKKEVIDAKTPDVDYQDPGIFVTKGSEELFTILD